MSGERATEMWVKAPDSWIDRSSWRTRGAAQCRRVEQQIGNKARDNQFNSSEQTMKVSHPRHDSDTAADSQTDWRQTGRQRATD